MRKLSERLTWLFDVVGNKGMEAARFAGVDPGYISNLRSGKRSNPSAQVLDKLSEFFGCNRDWLATGDGVAELTKQTMLTAGVSEEIASQMMAGPAGAAVKMTDIQLIEAIIEHSRRFQNDKPIMRSAHAGIAAALAVELQSRHPFSTPNALSGKRAGAPVHAPTRKEKRGRLRDIAAVSLSIYGSLPAGWPDGREGANAQQPARIIKVRRGAWPEGAFGLDVRGDSMNAAKPEPILDGDTVILVSPEQREPKSGDIVAALLDGGTCLKRLVNGDRPAHLKSESTNPMHGVLHPAHELVIQGVVVGKL